MKGLKREDCGYLALGDLSKYRRSFSDLNATISFDLDKEDNIIGIEWIGREWDKDNIIEVLKVELPKVQEELKIDLEHRLQKIDEALLRIEMGRLEEC